MVLSFGLQPRSASAALLLATHNPQNFLTTHTILTPSFALVVREDNLTLLSSQTRTRKSRVLFPCMFQRFGNSVQPSQVRSAGFLASEFGRCTHHGTHQRHRWLSVGGMPVETSRRAGDFTIVKTMMDSYWGPAFAYYWRNPTPAEERRKKKAHTHSFSGDEARRSQSRISRHFDMIPYD